MDKQKADQIITGFSKKIYGFAVKKSFSYDEAEEISAQMVTEVYAALLHAENVVNIEGYIWRICEHVYARYVMREKKSQGISIDGIEIPVYDEYDLGEANDELIKLRKEIGFLSSERRNIVYSFYYEKKSIRQIAEKHKISEGTVKWHLNKARNDLKEGFSVERKVGRLGLAPIEALNFTHNGMPGSNGGPEYYLKDKLNLNIVYSVYYEPKTIEGIAEELGMTPVYLEERVEYLAANGFLTELKGKKYTTYVKFSPEKVSLEMGENIIKMQFKAARTLAKEYVPQVRKAIEKFDKIYIPGGNRELFEAAAIFLGIVEKCTLSLNKNLSKYRIRTLDGSDYFASVDLKTEIVDPDYQFTITELVKDYSVCGAMERKSGKYPSVSSWSVDTRLCNRVGGWQDNLVTDYDAVYELINGKISDTITHAEKFGRMRHRRYITEAGKVNIMVLGCSYDTFCDLIPMPDKALLDEFAGFALEQGMMLSKLYPSQMQDYIIGEFVVNFIGNTVAMMVMDILYDEHVLKPLTGEERVTANLMMFSDVLPENKLSI